MHANETKIFFTVLLGAAILAIVIVFFIVTTVRHHRRNTSLSERQMRLDIGTLEDERKRIASDLHDELGPVLSSIKLHINNLSGNSENDSRLINVASLNIDQVLDKIRETSNSLMPNILITKGLKHALIKFLNNISNTKALKICKEITDEAINISVEREVHIYRIVQEITTNVIKHSKASNLNIALIIKDNKINLKASDNGIGFNLDTIHKESTGLGLRNIVSRVNVLNGDLYIDTKPNKGTNYTILIPL